MTTVPVGVLTDAELALLAPPPTRVGPRPVMPVWSDLAEETRPAVLHAAGADLRSRGLLDDDTPSVPRHDLRQLLRLRRAATAVLAVARTTPDAADHWYAHVARDVVLLEQVSSDGSHRFALAPAAALPELVVAAVLHPVAGTTSLATPDDQTDWLHADLDVRRPGTSARTTWLSGPGGCWRLDVRPVAVDGDRARDEVADLASRLAGGGPG